MNKYNPQVNDLVRWGEHEGWIYYRDEEGEYISIEIHVKHKNCDQLLNGTSHRKDHILIVCYPQDWGDLEYIRSRNSIYDD